MRNDYEIFITDRNIILSLDTDEVYFFNTTNFDNDDFNALKDNNVQYLIDKGLALSLDSEMIYRMYLGMVNKNKCIECSTRMGAEESSKGFGDLTA